MSDTQRTLERELERLSPPNSSLSTNWPVAGTAGVATSVRAGVLDIVSAIAVGRLGVNAIRSAAPRPADPAPTPELRQGSEFIVFQPPGTGLGWDLAAQDPETGEVRTIVETDGIVDCPDAERCRSFVESAEWSPDGRWRRVRGLQRAASTAGRWVRAAPTVGGLGHERGWVSPDS